MTKELTPRQVREQAAYEAERQPEKVIPPRVSPRDYLRKQAGWPPLKVK